MKNWRKNKSRHLPMGYLTSQESYKSHSSPQQAAEYFGKVLDKKTILGISLAGLIIFSWLAAQTPLAIYEWGKFKAKHFNKGTVAGLSITKLPVPYHRQEHALSCEVAALKMVLDYQGISVNEDELINFLPFDPTPKSKNVWGDPYTGFVGSIDGKMGVTGYGVYWEPIAQIGRIWKKTEVLGNGTPQDLAEHISEGRPIIIWGYYGRGKKLNWTTPEGKRIEAINGEHARVVTGFVGDKENPEGFVILDPIYGELFWTTDDLLKNWSAFDNYGVVVYAEDPVRISAE